MSNHQPTHMNSELILLMRKQITWTKITEANAIWKRKKNVYYWPPDQTIKLRRAAHLLHIEFSQNSTVSRQPLTWRHGHGHHWTLAMELKIVITVCVCVRRVGDGEKDVSADKISLFNSTFHSIKQFFHRNFHCGFFSCKNKYFNDVLVGRSHLCTPFHAYKCG